MPLQPCGDPREYAACGTDPDFILTNFTGCCPGRSGAWVAGVCDTCAHAFTCPNIGTGKEFKWGAAVAITVNIGISVGMALQKHAHTLVEERVKASVQVSNEAAEAARKKGFAAEPCWWVGFLMQISGEIGNLVAYGDPNTPSSVVASLGCVAVIANSLISVFFLGEACKRTDALGVVMIVVGVVLIIEYVPHDTQGGTSNLIPCPIAYSGNYSQNPCALPAILPDGDRYVSGVEACNAHGLFVQGSDYWYLVQPVWLCYLAANILAYVGLFIALQRHGPKHCASYLSLADIAGGFTVCASVTVSTLLFNRLMGHGDWYVLAEPVFWLCVLVLGATLPVQVNYLNKALAEYDVSLVVPTHYVLFTLASIGAPSVLYQELTLDPSRLGKNALPPGVMVLLFTIGIMLVCGGVRTLSMGRERAVPLREISNDSMAGVEAIEMQERSVRAKMQQQQNGGGGSGGSGG